MNETRVRLCIEHQRNISLGCGFVIGVVVAQVCFSLSCMWWFSDGPVLMRETIPSYTFSMHEWLLSKLLLFCIASV